MIILKENTKKKEIYLKTEDLDDLWTLHLVLEPGDTIIAYTERKIRIGDEGDRNAKFIKKRIKLNIEVEKTDLAKQKDTLRVSGVTAIGNEDVPKGSYHTIKVDDNSNITIIKDWKKYEIEKLKEATKKKYQKILFLIHDREEAIIAELKKHNYHILAEIKGAASKKRMKVDVKENFYSVLEKKLKEYHDRFDPFKIIVASPGFFKEDFLKSISNSLLREKIILATCSSVSKNAITELLSQEELKNILKEQKASHEIKLMTKVMKEISTEGLATYGFDLVKEASESGAIDILLISDKKIITSKDENKYKEIEEIMRRTDKTEGTVHIINSEHEGGEILDGIGGIAALLRYKLN